MRTVDIIQKKRDGHALTSEEIHYLINGYSQGRIPDYQMSAWAMAVFFQGMTAEETASLTMSMAKSGELIDLSNIHGMKVDKHSTGGVGDTTTLVLAALVAAAGVPVAKMSGRGLGHTGGTIDKLESIAGFSVERSRSQFIEQVNQIGVAVISQSGNITPADKQLYALRDVTATVDSIPLIASSIMSKKIASGADAIVLDVKTGKGAFMKTLEESIALAQAMVQIGEHVGRETVAIVSDMNQPLGFAVGNALEVKEAIETLRGRGPQDLRELCLVLGAHMLLLGKGAENVSAARSQLEQIIDSGQAIEKFKQLISAQGGNDRVIDQPELFPAAKRIVQIHATSSGYIQAIEAESIGIAAMMLGAGRETKQSIIDPSVGIVLNKKVGDAVKAGESIATLHMSETQIDRLSTVEGRVLDAFEIADVVPIPPKLIHAIVTKNGVQMM